MSDIKLKPCPKCGSTSVKYFEYLDDKYNVFCKHCGFESYYLHATKEQADEAWNAQPRHLRWTTETPTEPGWYWCRSNVQPKDTAIVLVRDGVFELDEELIEAASLRFQWAGPIPEPQEQEGQK